MPTDLARTPETLIPPVLNDTAQFDYLTDEAIRHAALHAEPMAVLRIRIHGYHASTVAFLRTRVRETDLIACMGDGTFAILLPSTNFLEATVVAEKLFARCSMSIGVASSEEGLLDLMERSERAMQKAIHAGGNRVSFIL